MQRPPSRSNRLQTGKESWAVSELSKTEESLAREAEVVKEGRDQDEDFLCYYKEVLELWSLGWWGCQTLSNRACKG